MELKKLSEDLEDVGDELGHILRQDDLRRSKQGFFERGKSGWCTFADESVISACGTFR